MGQRFKVGLCLLILLPGVLLPVENARSEEVQISGEALDRVIQRMKTLAKSLGKIPTPPNLDGTIQIPEINSSNRGKTED